MVPGVRWGQAMDIRRPIILVATLSAIWAATIMTSMLFRGCAWPPTPIASFAHVTPPRCVAFSPDGKYLVAGGTGFPGREEEFRDGELTVWEVASQNKIGSLQLPGSIQSIAFAPAGDLLAVACGTELLGRQPGDRRFKERPAELRLLSFPELAEKGKLTDGILIKSVCFAPNGASLAYSVCQEWRPPKAIGAVQIVGAVKLCDVNPLRVRTTVTDAFSVVDFSPDGRTLAVPALKADGVTASGFVKLFDTSTGQAKDEFEVPGSRSLTSSSLQYSQDGKLLRLGLWTLWDIADKKPRDMSAFHEALGQVTDLPFSEITLSPDGTLLAGFIVKRSSKFFPRPIGEHWVFVWDLKADRPILSWCWEPRGLPLTALAVSPDNKLLAVGTRDQWGWDTENGQARGGVKLFRLDN
jgi:WD40 repeat protein